MKLVNLALISVLAFAGAAFAQVPAGTWTGNDTSDGQNNTGMGTGALGTGATNGGSGNTASGFEVLYYNVSGNQNTAAGQWALAHNLGGNGNTVAGYQALYLADSDDNAAFGSFALASSYGEGNTAIGAFSQEFVVGGQGSNTSVGEYALQGVGSITNSYPTGTSTGSYNTAVGIETLYLFTTASYNAALGQQALYSTTTGNYNTASGYDALYSTTDGNQNSATGAHALHNNKNGNFNTALGAYALYATTSGSSNIAVGEKAGYDVTTGSNNIEIGSLGAATDTALIRIGTQGTQKSAHVAGISGVAVTGTGVAVVVNASGQLGIAGSSERFKTAIAPMGDSTSKLEALQPITFEYKSEPHGTRQYGLIAEEVAKVYPELVVRDAKGAILSVRYDELAPMLLNEMKVQKQQLTEQAAHIGQLEAAVLALQASKQSH